jgi:hypothetical protein
MIVGLDASNIRRGGRVTHLVEVLRAANPPALGAPFHSFQQPAKRRQRSPAGTRVAAKPFWIFKSTFYY